MGLDHPYRQLLSLMAIASDDPVSLLSLLSICLFAPVAEEMVMRGGIEEKLLQWKNNPVLAILVSSLLFGILHLSPSLIIGTFLSGLIAGWVYYRTRNVWICILMHMSNNITSCLVDWLASDIQFNSDDLLVKLAIFICVALVAVSIYYFRKMTA